jgi:putative membrane protein
MVVGNVVRLGCSAAAVWLSTIFLPGITVHAHSIWGTIGTLVLVALIFGVVNAVIKPVAKTAGCLIYALTFGLIALVVNGLLLLLVSWISGKLSIPFHVANFWPDAVIGALIISVVSTVSAWFVRGLGKVIRSARRPGPPPPRPTPRYGR